MAPNNRMEDMGKDVRKLRKPVIEKMRRDRINSSIEQLRILLEKEFQRHQLPSKPEKADILEMTVTFLRQQLHRATRVVAPYKHSFPLSMKDIVCAPHGKHLATQRSIWMDPQKRRAANESKCHPLRNINQVIVQQGAQECSSADLWRPW
ncbi:transcription factor HES-5-like [Ranitomeya variabilis]|uniref:transcription factor HES-5-like n=1 Tax=Ranitomeya variabilis TaxID=490064 RepID=UPI004056E1FB